MLPTMRPSGRAAPTCWPARSSRCWPTRAMATDTRPPSILRPLVEELQARREKARLGGGSEKIAKQHDAGKLTARERIGLLIDDGTFTELGIHGGPHFSQRA